MQPAEMGSHNLPSVFHIGEGIEVAEGGGGALFQERGSRKKRKISSRRIRSRREKEKKMGMRNEKEGAVKCSGEVIVRAEREVESEGSFLQKQRPSVNRGAEVIRPSPLPPTRRLGLRKPRLLVFTNGKKVDRASPSSRKERIGNQSECKQACEGTPKVRSAQGAPTANHANRIPEYARYATLLERLERRRARRSENVRSQFSYSETGTINRVCYGVP